jgi:hypothetical protein
MVAVWFVWWYLRPTRNGYRDCTNFGSGSLSVVAESSALIAREAPLSKLAQSGQKG